MPIKKISRTVAFFKKYSRMLFLMLEKRKGKERNFEDVLNDSFKDGYFLLLRFPFRTSSTIDSSLGDLIKIDKQQVEKMKGIPGIEFVAENIIKFPVSVKIKDNTIHFSNGKSLLFDKSGFVVL